MDFASLMKAQITKAKPQPSASSSSETATSKYQRRADLEAERQAAYAAEQERLEDERQERLAKKRKHEEEEAERNAEREEKKRRLAEESKTRREEEELKQEKLRRKRLGLPDLPDKSGDGDGNEDTPLPEGEDDIPEAELQTKLRAINEPATLFGESHPARLKRYKTLKQRALTITKTKLSTGPIPTTLEPVTEAEMKVPDSIPTDAAALTFVYRQLASYFTLLLTEWSLALSRRDPAVKTSQAGKQAYNIYAACVSDLKPLYRKFEANNLNNNNNSAKDQNGASGNNSNNSVLLRPILEIVRAAQQRRYVDANDAYLRMSIGTAAWPIGVTMVGIHERSAREKLHGGAGQGDGQAHIMSDEVTRKYLQSIKRCLSFAQTRWPPEDVGQLMG